MPNLCGSCTLCCKLTDVVELLKPCYKWCPVCVPGKGCGTYETRPKSCKEFKCFWLAEGWPEDLRPDRCRVVFEALTGVDTVLAMVEPSRPDAWRTKKIEEVIRKLAAKGRPVIVHPGPGINYFFLPEGKTRDDVIADAKETLRIRHGSPELHN